MANNKVIANGETLIDLTEDTVTPSTMVNGIVAHDASGVRIVGTFDPSIYVLKAGDIMSGNLETPKVYHSEGTANNAYGYSLDKDGLTIEGNHISGDTYDKVFVEDTRIKLASGLYDADRDTKRLILNPSSINMYEYGDSTSIIREKVEISKDRIKIHNSSGGDTSIGNSELTIGNKDVLHTHQSLVGGWGTTIPANADLNTVTYLKVGRYFCGVSATAASLLHCPVNDAFCMTVEAPINENIDNESTTTWQYRVRTLYRYNGEIYRQLCDSGSTAGVFKFGEWQQIITSRNYSKVYSDQIDSRNMASQTEMVQGSITSQGTDSSATTRVRTGYIAVSPNTYYSFATNATAQIYEIHEYTSAQVFIKYTSINATTAVIKTSATTGRIRVLMRLSNNATIVANDCARLQMEKGDVLSSTYVPYLQPSTSVTAPFLSYSDLGTATTDSAFFQAWLKRLSVNYDYFAGKIIQARVQPNVAGVVYGHMYGGVDANGMPNYSGFTYISVGVLKYFGTNGGTFYLRSVNYTSEV